ncbi:MAG TPA: hypothetical protein VH413_06745 [Verrucomicrobiae bacterium]|jgi:Zn-dependent peptidase ImmA (M78 family)|nr:hypothetical protein [Verrucomicrobiae bacterium]
MPINPEKSADNIFQESFSALMAHTIRGVTRHFLKNGIELDVRILVDRSGLASAGGSKAPSIIIIEPSNIKGVAGGTTKINRVKASIFIHKNANKHLARICIAHEMYHLLLELEAYITSDRKTWAAIPVSRAVEEACNIFAWQLCRAHDKFNKDEASREKHVYFPEHTFDAPLKTSSTDNCPEWPRGISLDPDNTFHGKTGM